ncbi:MAG: tRNA uridine-5-carboxymethylaminomethyl(34) synthesis GTPase MnmE [Paracoccaceae bacterium]
MDTIFAPATARGRAGLSVMRVSGPGALAAVAPLSGALPEHGRTLRHLRDRDGGTIDEALILTFAPGRSFTGEAVVELHLHGSPAVERRVTDLLAATPGLRIAEPGEFTRRAVAHGRMDLSQAEAMADLIDAQTEGQRRQAMRGMEGVLSARATRWRADLLRAQALTMAVIDFADEEVPEALPPDVARIVADLRAAFAAELKGAAFAEALRDGFEVAITGAPNVGKSTLLNRIAGREVALVSEEAGTTRDVLEAHIDLNGLPVTFVDTAGLREAGDTVEALGIARGRARAATADLVVHLGDASSAPDGAIVVTPKADLAGRGVSGLTGQGVDTLMAQVEARLSALRSGDAAIWRARHRHAISDADAALHEAQAEMAGPMRHDLLAERLREAAGAVGRIVGDTGVEEVLGEVFATFCIGK